MHSVKSLLRNPLARGMFAYSVLWPTGSIIQQTIAGQHPGNYDWKKAMRFSMYGSLVVAPTLYAWVRFSVRVFPHQSIGSAVTKAAVEQVTYGPAATCLFFFGMTLLESQDWQLAKKEVADKFFTTYKIGLCYWPFIQTFNFYCVPERHRIILLSSCSLLWTVLLAYMKQLEHDKQMALLAESVSNPNQSQHTISSMHMISNSDISNAVSLDKNL